VTGANPRALAFNTSGALTTAMPLTAVGAAPAGAAALDFALDFTGTTQFGSAFGVTSITQNGYASGKLASFEVDDGGVIMGRYTNSETKALGMVALTSFANPQGLTAIGNNQWVETVASGQPLTGAPGSGTLGLLQSGAVEDSNVDLTTELVNLIVAQRMYQANAQTIKTQDSILQTLVNLR
jgi:flagellar hook protein FlgE